MAYMKEDHILPTIRITRAVLDNFKSVEHGEIDFQCGREFVPYGTKSDLLGIYGQNGSGKTALIEALSILKCLIMGQEIDDIYADCLPNTEKSARIEFTFDLQYPDNKTRKAVYACSLKKEKMSEKRAQDYVRRKGEDSTEEIPFTHVVKVFDEVLSVGGDINGKKQKLQPVFDTSIGKPFGPKTKLNDWLMDGSAHFIDLEVNKRLAEERSQSFIFMEETADILSEHGHYHPYYQVYIELHLYCVEYLHVVDTKSSGIIRLNVGIPIYTSIGVINVRSFGATKVPEPIYGELTDSIKDISDVLGQIVPGLSLKVNTVSDTTLKNGEKAKLFEIHSVRNGKEMPLRYESDGVRKIISELFLIIRAYSEQSATVAIDEFDAGIFEYLLGELLQVFENSGKGQFIFTSHNLRPLEVISRKAIYFTTTNPTNRYVRLKNISTTSNLRTTYFREIVLGGQDEELYAETQQYRIVEALDNVAARMQAYYEESEKAMEGAE